MRERNIKVWLPLTPLPQGTWSTTQACALTGNRTSDPLILRLALNPLSYASQGMPSICFLFVFPMTSSPLITQSDPSKCIPDYVTPCYSQLSMASQHAWIKNQTFYSPAL